MSTCVKEGGKVGFMRRAILFVVGTFVFGAIADLGVACGTNTSQFDGGDGGDGSSNGDSPFAGDSPFGGDGSQNDGSACNPPDMLIVLDHTDSMSQAPNGTNPANTDAGHAKTKWVLACDAVQAVTAPPTDQTLRFGLELFPLDPAVITDAGGTGKCETLTALLGGTNSTNTQCQAGEVLVSPNVGTGAQVGNILDPETLKLCVSTPINSALQTAQQTLAQIAVSGRKQFVILVTDGGETCVSDPTVVATTQALATAGVDTFVVGFGAADAGSAGVNLSLLNDLACAGMTATNFSTSCVKPDGGAGYVAVKPNGTPVFLLAEDGTSLEQTLQTVTKSVCCGCVN